MVNTNKGVPELPNATDEAFTTHDDVILGTDSDTDDDDIALAGYEPLPLAPTDDNVNHDDSDDSDEDSGVDSGGQPSDDNLPPINRVENELVRQVWSAPSPPVLDFKMDNDKVNEVKQAMVNITLPPSSIPEWANNIPEDEWKQHLISRLQDLQKSSK